MSEKIKKVFRPRVTAILVLLLLVVIGSFVPKTPPSKQPTIITGSASGHSADIEQKSTKSNPVKSVIHTVSSTTAVEPVKPIDPHGSSILASKKYPQYVYHALATPNDPLLSGSWYQSKIQTDRAWDLSTGSSSTVIAVIDTGFALSHQDLTNKWFTNTGEQGTTSSGGHCWTGTPVSKATNNCDDDQNGYVDDWRGWDFSANDNDPQTGTLNPSGAGTTHASMVSGIIAGTANNSLGNAGIDWSAKIMPLQVLGDDGTGYTYDIAAAIQYAADNGANIINMSLGGGSFDQALLDAITYANNHGVLVVAASGNCGNSTIDSCAGLPAGGMTYPARYSNVIAAGATTSSDVRASFSSYGPELDIVAPGSAVGSVPLWSSGNPTSGYTSAVSGTSFASPMVAGVAGLIRSQLTSPTVAQLTSILLDSADKVGDLSAQLRSDSYGFGRLNAHKATLLAKAIETPPGNVGSTEIQARQGPYGGITRSTTGTVGSNEWVLVSCRVDPSDICSSSVTNGSTTQRFYSTDTTKGGSVYNMFVSGASLTNGTNTFAVQNKNYAVSVGNLTK